MNRIDNKMQICGVTGVGNGNEFSKRGGSMFIRFWCFKRVSFSVACRKIGLGGLVIVFDDLSV